MLNWPLYCLRSQKTRQQLFQHTWNLGPWLGIATLSTIRVLIVDLYLQLVSGIFKRLIDSGSLDCFVNLGFIIRNNLRIQEIDFFSHTLIDGTINHCMNQVILLPIQLACRSLYMIEYYATPLDSFCEVVLDYSWLRDWNSTIDQWNSTLSLPNQQKVTFSSLRKLTDLLVICPLLANKSYVFFINILVY